MTLEHIRSDYKDVTDFVVKTIRNVNIIYLESLISQDKINDYILKQIVSKKIILNIEKVIASPHVVNINNYDDLKIYLESGFTIVIYKNKILAVETKGNLSRSISTPEAEPTLYGPKEAFNENIQNNIGLIKRRIKSNKLKNINLFIGRYSKTITSILYIDGISDLSLVNEVKKKLNKIDIDGINDVGELKKYLIDEKRNVFPALRITERPDLIARSLLNGKIVIMIDNSPFAIILPSFLADFINPIADNYNKNMNINFVKTLRLFCFLIAIMVPGIYVALTTFNQEALPTSLLLNIQNQRLDVPFPAFFECIITLIICEILRESDLRFPSSYGSATSILGALVLGEAAVSAGIVSPIMIIVVAITFITSLIFTDIEIINAIRAFRFLYLLMGSIFGLYGIGLTFIFMFVNLINFENFGKPYLYPIQPFDLTYIKDTLFKMDNKKRSKLLSNNTYKEET